MTPLHNYKLSTWVCHRALNLMNIQKLKSKSVWNISSQLSEWLPSFKKKRKEKRKMIKYCQKYFYTSFQTCAWNFHVLHGACHHAKSSLPGILAFPGACKESGDDGKFWSLNWEEVVNWSKNKIQIKEKGNSRFAVQILVGHRDKFGACRKWISLHPWCWKSRTSLSSLPLWQTTRGNQLRRRKSLLWLIVLGAPMTG